MTAENSQIFDTSALNDLEVGRVQLRVPLFGNVIQIGTAGITPTEKITVDASPQTVSIKRTDGTPMQVEISDFSRPKPVFDRPVDEVSAVRVMSAEELLHPPDDQKNKSALWIGWTIIHPSPTNPEGEIKPIGGENFSRFMRTVAFYAAHKQQKAKLQKNNRF